MKRISSQFMAGLTLLFVGSGFHVQAQEVQEIDLSPANAQLDLGSITFPSGHVMKANYGIGSAAHRRAGDEEGVFYTATDRGPNIKCGDAQKVIKRSLEDACKGMKAGKIFPLPDFSPSILTFKLKDGKAELLQTLTLKDRDGAPISGRSAPLKITNTEGAFSKDGDALPYDPEGLDVEGLARLKDGSFWLSEEYGPSLVHVAADGKILKRLVPAGMEADLKGANYDVIGSLPAILAKRKLNRGAESLAISEDEAYLYFSMQSPLANPNAKAYKASRNVRLLKVDATTGKAVAEYVYQLDKADSFPADNAKKARKQKDVKVSELTLLAGERFVILERISKTTKFYAIDLSDGATNILGSKWDDITTSPSLAQSDLTDANIVPLKKDALLIGDGDLYPKKIEGIALFGEKDVVLVNDNDFGIMGAPSKIIRVTLDKAWK